MGIPAEDVERVRAATDIVALISEHVPLRRVGRRWQGLCPFHAEKTPSFSVNPELGVYHCFGCKASGDAITFLRETQQLDFVGAVEQLAGRAGIQVSYDSGREQAERGRRKVLAEAMGRAVAWYHERLLSAPDAAAARGYLRRRGYDGELVRRYQLGWAPDEWDALTRALRLPTDVLRDTGLGFVNKRNRVQDAFRARVLFPIFDAQGVPVAFGGRILPGADGPKYKNSPQTPIYDKSRVLYGLNWAKGEIVERDEVVICEGYTDVIGFAQAGVGRAVATCGTALTEQHVTVLRRFARRLVLAFDADAAGQGAAERLYEWERTHEVDVAVAALPAGSDPGDLGRADPDALRAAVAEAKPFLGFRIDRSLARADLRTPEGRARAAEAALEMVREHPSEIVRRQYAGEVAARCDLPVEQLVTAVERRGRTPIRVEAVTRSPSRVGPADLALALAVQEPESVAHLLDEALFDDDLRLAAYRALARAVTFNEALEHADPRAAELLQRLAVEEVDAEPLDVVALLAADAASREIAALEAAAGRLADDPEAFAHAAELIGWLKRRVEELRDPDMCAGSLEQLVAWLADRAEEG